HEQAWIRIQGELWQAHAEKPLQTGDRVKIIKIDGLIVWVGPMDN
ncbi:MAG: NfeD-like C-terminal, partner-binding, partial [Gammaproteobacteria bacterium]|nr:NfeD-like C-terminal, partner-binding [Gammaproteobacteria bacterium]